jgi:ribulose-bisphosphate carboxylase small chain
VRLTQGCFSFLPDLTDEQIQRQVTYCINKGWAMNVEWTDDPHPRNSYEGADHQSIRCSSLNPC